MQRLPRGSKSLDSVHSWIQYAKSDYWFQAQMPVTKKALMAAVGCPLGVRLEAYYDKLMSVIDDIEDRKIVFLPQRYRDEKHIYRHTELPQVVYLEPYESRVQALSKHWELFGRCVKCNGNKFIPVLIDDKQWHACYYCFPPSQYKSIGAKELPVLLVVEAVKKDYL